jgi:hypothetical protein
VRRELVLSSPVNARSLLAARAFSIAIDARLGCSLLASLSGGAGVASPKASKSSGDYAANTGRFFLVNGSKQSKRTVMGVPLDCF